MKARVRTPLTFNSKLTNSLLVPASATFPLGNETVLPGCHSLHFSYAAVMGNARARRLLWAWLIAAVLALLLLTAFFAALAGPKVPVYQNKNLYAWAEDLQKAQQNYSDPERWKKVEAATGLSSTIAIAVCCHSQFPRPHLAPHFITASAATTSPRYGNLLPRH
jgi:hypothetical protein